jgi:pimeloyl-ACP methyl ester carboxylesterase
MRQQRVNAHGIGINVVDWREGSQQALFCIHGITANARAFDAIATALAPEIGVIAPDLRGRGDSDKPDGPYGVRTHASDMLAVLDALRLERVTIAGWSLGSLIGLHLAAAQPERVERLILLDPPLIALRDEARESLGRLQGRLSRTYPDMDTAIATMRATPLLGGVWDEAAEAYVRADLEQLPDGSVRHRMRIETLNAEWAAMEHDPPLTKIFPNVSCPTLILRATDTLFQPGDELLTPDDASRAARLLRNGQTRDIPGTNHYTITLGTSEGTVAAIREIL